MTISNLKCKRSFPMYRSERWHCEGTLSWTGGGKCLLITALYFHVKKLKIVYRHFQFCDVTVLHFSVLAHKISNICLGLSLRGFYFEILFALYCILICTNEDAIQIMIGKLHINLLNKISLLGYQNI